MKKEQSELTRYILEHPEKFERYERLKVDQLHNHLYDKASKGIMSPFMTKLNKEIADKLPEEVLKDIYARSMQSCRLYWAGQRAIEEDKVKRISKLFENIMQRKPAKPRENSQEMEEKVKKEIDRKIKEDIDKMKLI